MHGGRGQGGVSGKAGANHGGASGSAGTIIHPEAGNGGEAGSAAGAGAGGEDGSECSDTVCSSACVDLTSDENNCGACGYVCVHNRACVAGRCTPAWQALASENEPTSRTRHAAAVIDGKFVVLGGSHDGTGSLADVAAYDLATDQWSTLPDLQAARCGHIAVSTGSEIYAFGGLTDCSNGTTVGPGLERYTPSASAWEVITKTGEPSHRYNTTGIWTGSGLFIYGGGDNTLPTLATGAAFSGSAWSEADCSLTECDRSEGVMFLDGDVVHFMGGAYNPTYPTPPVATVDATSGLTYDLAENSWSTWSYPAGTTEKIAYRYADDGRRIFFLYSTDVVTIFDRASSGWLANDTSEMPSGFCTQAATAWSGSEMIAWSGDCGSGAASVGGRYQPKAP
ncbi:MAG TPA: kelch repeat-containing protein [Polyangiaceae bacterium]|nr:kelch repeat-containing protein [Polyangiaceae bacterium]